METTKYGLILIVLEFGVKKIDFDNSKFNTFFSVFDFLKDTVLLEKLTS